MNHYPQLPDFETNPKKIIKLKSALLLNLSLSNSGVFNQDILKNDNDNDINEDAIKPYPLKRFDALGRGSSSVVYRSILLDTLTICAEKVIVSSDSNKKGMILRELKSLQVATEIKGENCENIVKLLKVVPNPYDGTLSICLEMMDGGSLQDLVNEGGCQDELVLYRILKQMLTGLQYLHSLRLLHRDLKPSNALISSKGVVKLADFGISRFLEEGNSLAESFVGTLDYMAPERMIGQPYSYSSDVWALGLTIHTLALGSYPYTIKERGFWSLLNAIQNTTITFPPSFSFSQSFCNFLCKSCDKDPLKRPTSSELLILVTDTLDKMEYNIDFAEEKQPEIQIQTTTEKTPKKVMKKDTKGSKMKEPILNTKKNTSIKGNNNKTVTTTTTTTTTTTVPSTSLKSIKSKKPKETVVNDTSIKADKKKSVINTNDTSNKAEKMLTNNNDDNNDKENLGISNFRKKITKYHSKIKNVTSMSARDAFKLALAWRTYITEKIMLLDSNESNNAIKEEIYNNPVPNISINSIDTLAGDLNCSKALMRGAFLSVITNIKEMSTSAILEDGRIKNIEDLDTYGSLTNKRVKKTLKYYKEDDDSDDDLFDFDIDSIYESINSIKTSSYDTIDEVVIDDDDDDYDNNDEANNESNDNYDDDDFYDYDDK